VPSVIRLNQERVPRAAGWQLTQWVSRYPDAVTYPDSLEALFLIRNVGGRESFERVCTMQDLAAYPEANLRYFEAKGLDGDSFVTLVRSGQTLRVVGSSTQHWVQAAAPYNTRSFTVNSGLLLRANGPSPIMMPGGIVTLPNYQFSDDDVGRWFEFSGFATSAFNGLCQIRSVRGNTAQTNKNSGYLETSAGGWFSYWVSIETNVGAGLEPRYFPTKQSGLSWELDYATGSTQTGNGGQTHREAGTGNLYRCVRWTSVEPNQDAALAFMASVQDGVRRLQAESSANNDGTDVVTVTDFP
jgi:hypothetical protein